MPKGTYIINHNGDLVDGNKSAGPGTWHIDARNRAFRYGDSLFESICLKDGKMPLLPLHVDRLLTGCAVLKMKPRKEWNVAYFHEHIEKLALAAGLKEAARIRLSVYRAGDGLYLPTTNTCEFLIEASSLPEHAFSENTTGLNVSIYTENVKTPSRLGTLKSGNALLYVLASIAAKEHEVDDMFLLNEHGSIVEATGSNIFYFHEDKLYTPPLDDGCVEGVMREYIVANTEVIQKTTTLQHLAEADEVFLTNATLGIRPVENFKSKNYPAELTRELAKKICSGLWG